MALRTILMAQFSVLCIVLFASCFTGGQAAAQSSAPSLSDETQLEDIVVNGASLKARAEAFVASVGAPVEGRKLAIWTEEVCVGAAGLMPETSRVMVDRILDWAHSLGIRIGSPGCHPNILIVFGADGDRMSQELVRTRRLDFDASVSMSRHGDRALRAFQSSHRPVRWWQMSVPIDPDTGRPIVRDRGQTPFSPPPEISRPSDFGSFGQITMGSRLYDDSIDALRSTVVVVDTKALEQISFGQLSDYVAMVVLAQIDPDVSAPAPSILGIFDDTGVQQQNLSAWDQAFLQALYSTHQRNVGVGADGALIAKNLVRKLETSGVADNDP